MLGRRDGPGLPGISLRLNEVQGARPRGFYPTRDNATDVSSGDHLGWASKHVPLVSKRADLSDVELAIHTELVPTPPMSWFISGESRRRRCVHLVIIWDNKV